MSVWGGPIDIEPLPGGLTNRNFSVASAGERFFVRIPSAASPHPIERPAEIAATGAAGRIALGPHLVFAGEGALVLRFLPGRTLTAEDFADPRMMERIVALLCRCRDEMPAAYDGPMVDHSPCAVLGHYRALIGSRPNRWQSALATHEPQLDLVARRLGTLPKSLSHNDFHPANVMEWDGRLWLVDWEYAGLAPPLVDLAGMAVNGLLDDSQACRALDLWEAGTAGLARDAFFAARLAAALRDLLWGYAQDAFGEGFDGTAYIAANEERVARAAVAFLSRG